MPQSIDDLPAKNCPNTTMVMDSLKRNGIDPDKDDTATFGFLQVKGQPHLSLGWATLCSSPSSLLVVVLQAAIISACVVILVGSTNVNSAWTKYWPAWVTAHSFFKTPLVPMMAYLCLLFVPVNLGWVVVASRISGVPFRPRLKWLLISIVAFIPLRFVASRFMPKWFFMTGHADYIAGISARILQFSWAYSLATGVSRAELEKRWAGVVDRYCKEVIDAYSSYIVLPGLFFYLLLGLVIKGPWPKWFVSGYYEYELIIVGTVGFIMAFNKGLLAAATFQWLTETGCAPVSRLAGDAPTPEVP